MSEHRARIEGAIRRFLSHFAQTDYISSLKDVAMSLDELVGVYWRTPDVEPTTDSLTQAPGIDEAEFERKAAPFFGSDDVIWLVDPDGGPDQKPMCTFATSELSEIANDLARVLWEFEHGSEADAIWEFRFGYQSHWGEHLHRVRHHVHGLGAW